VAETILASHGGGGNWGRALSLAEATLDALALADSETCARILLYFLWQWIGFLGLRPEFEHCSLCGESLPADAMSFFALREGGMICAACSGGEGQGLVEAGPGCRLWLETVRPLPPAQISRYTLDGKSLREVKALTTAILAEALGRRLTSWDW
jgi:recombinational DNA repair protein (RecF pathway)